MRGVFTRDERTVVVFLAASLAIGSLVLLARRVEPGLGPEGLAEACQEQVPGRASAEEPPPGPIDLNEATAQELTALPGIGPVRAAAIVRLREARGAFRSIDELLDVRGIGPVTLERLRSLAIVGRGPDGRGAESASSPDSVWRGSEMPE
jgi:comEA protein